MGRVKVTLDVRPFFNSLRATTDRWGELLQVNLEKETRAELQRAARENFRNRTGRLYRSIRRIPGRGARIGSRNLPYWQWIDNFTRGMGLFARLLLRDPLARERIIERAKQATDREFGNTNR